MLRREEFEIIVVCLLFANLAAIYLVGTALWRELQRPARVIRIYQGGKTEASNNPPVSGSEPAA
jgi:hypothetical protein